MITQNDINAKIMTQNIDTKYWHRILTHMFCVIINDTKWWEFNPKVKIITQINNTKENDCKLLTQIIDTRY